MIGIVEGNPALSGRALQERIRIARQMVEANLLRVEQTRTRIDATRAQIGVEKPRREVLHESAYARLQARLNTLPVIEQAKGILIADSGCDPDEAFDILRKASQRTNVQVRELAADIVRRAVERGRERRAATNAPVSGLVRPVRIWPPPADGSGGMPIRRRPSA